MLSEVKSIRDGQKPLTDIPAMLRDMAELFEKGCYPETTELILIRNLPGRYPSIHGYGQTSLATTLSLLACAQAAIIEMMTNGKGPISR